MKKKLKFSKICQFFFAFFLDLSFCIMISAVKGKKISNFLNQRKTLRKSKSRKKSLHFFWSIDSTYPQEKWKNSHFEEIEGGREAGRGGDQTVNNGTEPWKGYGVYSLDCTAPVDRMWNHIWIFLCLNISSAFSFVIFYSIAKSMNIGIIENYD